MYCLCFICFFVLTLQEAHVPLRLSINKYPLNSTLIAYTTQHKIFFFREFTKTKSATAVQRAFCLRFNIQPQTRKEFVVGITNLSK
jgi:hypothetical protein